MEGKSGSLVLVGWFEAEGATLPKSHPLIVKTRKREADGTGKLKEEFDNALAVKPFVYDRKDSFAIPIWFDAKQNDYDVLWSTCMLTARSAEAAGAANESPDLPMSTDLRGLLGGIPIGREDRSDRPDEARKVLEDAYRLLRNLHRRSNWNDPAQPPTNCSVGDEYAKYLRKFGTVLGEGVVWGPKWVEHQWADPESRTIGDGDDALINPIWLVEQIKRMTYPMRLGVVHGDLHPGNIILRNNEPPAIIDFGWSQDHTHIAKDFVLMECNLRFLTLRPQIGEDQLRPFVKWIAWDEAAPDELIEYLKARAGLVSCVREQAAAVLGDDTDWTREYMVPLFLTAFGLLRYAPQLGHQQAAVLLVQSLAQHLTEMLNI
jgi:hypothetical protein